LKTIEADNKFSGIGYVPPFDVRFSELAPGAEEMGFSKGERGSFFVPSNGIRTSGNRGTYGDGAWNI
jgi:hypothetical protein